MTNNSASPIMPGVARVNQTPLYWTFTAAAASTLPSSIRGFGDVNGLSGIQSNLTNMQKSNELNFPESFTVYSMRMVFLNCSYIDFCQYCKLYTNRLIVNGVKLLEAPAEYFPGGAGASTATLGNANNGIPDSRSIVRFADSPIRIDAGANFRTEHVLGSVGNSAELAAISPTNPFWMRVYLDGMYSQAVG